MAIRPRSSTSPPSIAGPTPRATPASGPAARLGGARRSARRAASEGLCSAEAPWPWPSRSAPCATRPSPQSIQSGDVARHLHFGSALQGCSIPGSTRCTPVVRHIECTHDGASQGQWRPCCASVLGVASKGSRAGVGGALQSATDVASRQDGPARARAAPQPRHYHLQAPSLRTASTASGITASGPRAL